MVSIDKTLSDAVTSQGFHGYAVTATSLTAHFHNDSNNPLL